MKRQVERESVNLEKKSYNGFGKKGWCPVTEKEEMRKKRPKNGRKKEKLSSN